MTSEIRGTRARTPPAKLIEILNGTSNGNSGARLDIQGLASKRLSRETSHSSLLLSHENNDNHDNLHSLDQTDQATDWEGGDVYTRIETPPDNSRSTSPSSAASSSHELETPDTGYTTLNPTIKTGTERRSVHFRPRVRITSGISRYRHRHFPSTTDHGYISFSPSSSSSSISVPLRSSSDDGLNSPGWGSLGRRVALLTYNSRRRRSKERRQKRRHETTIEVNERTSLLSSSCKALYSKRGRSYERSDSVRDEGSNPLHDINADEWPRRLLNYHWWRSQLEPILCCFHAEYYSDTE